MSAVMDAVAAATAGVPRLHPLNEVTDTAYPYGVYSGSLGRGDGYTLDSRAGGRTGQVVVQAFGRTVDSAGRVMDQVIDALLDQVLPVEGWRCTPCRMALDHPAVVRDPDDDGVVGLTMPFTFYASKEP